MASPKLFTKAYLSILFLFWVSWIGFMHYHDLWSILKENIVIMITMVFGSLVAGVSAEGGGAVAFPVFTKLIHINTIDARNFGLLIQAIGMTMASYVIVINRIPVLWRVIFMVSLGGIFGQVIGASLVIPGATIKLMFTLIASMLGVTVFLVRWILKMPVYSDLPSWDFRYQTLFVLIGLVGGVFASQTSSGIDMITFIFLVILFGVNEKKATLSSVVIMAINSVVGASVHVFYVKDVSDFVYEAWWSAMPIVVLGAPLGTIIASNINRDTIIKVLLILIFIEFLSTILILPIQPWVGISMGIAGLSTFSCLIYLRRRYFQQRVNPE